VNVTFATAINSTSDVSDATIDQKGPYHRHRSPPSSPVNDHQEQNDERSTVDGRRSTVH
jgi:hypothetical protein